MALASKTCPQLVTVAEAALMGSMVMAQVAPRASASRSTSSATCFGIAGGGGAAGADGSGVANSSASAANADVVVVCRVVNGSAQSSAGRQRESMSHV